MIFKFLPFALFVAGGECCKLWLTNETFEKNTIGKRCMINFCTYDDMHCKHLRPGWDKLCSEYEGHDDVLIASVDCKKSGSALCESFYIDKYPTIVHGEWDNLKIYDGAMGSYTGLTTESTSHLTILRWFVEHDLQPICDPEHLDVCDEREKPLVQKYMNMKQEDLQELYQDTLDKVSVEIPLMKKVVAHHKHEPAAIDNSRATEL